jgi:hypothetical protein
MPCKYSFTEDTVRLKIGHDPRAPLALSQRKIKKKENKTVASIGARHDKEKKQ